MNLRRKKPITALIVLLFSMLLFAQDFQYGEFTIAQIHYDGGGDWYANPSALPNLLQFIAEHTKINLNMKPAKVRLDENDIFNYPYIYITGHGNIKFSDTEVKNLRLFFDSGGFLHADDNYGMDKSFRREIAKIFPNEEWIELPFEHEIYHQTFSFPSGLPKIHEHDNKPPQGFGIFRNGRLVIFYTYECDLGDGWEDPHVHKDPEHLRRKALQMGTNIVVYALTH